MSSRIGADRASIVQTYEGFVMDNHLGVAALAFLVYEYLITFDREVTLFWKSRLTGAVVLFLLNRYMVLATSLLAVSGIVIVFPASSCGLMAKVTNAFAMLQYIPWGAFSAIRVYALSNSSVYMLLIFLLSVAPAGAALAHLAFGLTGEMDPVFGCIVFDPTSLDLAHKRALPLMHRCHPSHALMTDLLLVTIGSRTCLILADALIILITWRTIPRRGSSWGGGQASTFGSILLWNGTLYFLTLLVLNLLHLIFTVVSVSAPFQNASYIILFVHPITGILLSRFLFDLQNANRQALHLNSHPHSSGSGSGSTDTSLSFARIVGSLASSLPGPHDRCGCGCGCDGGDCYDDESETTVTDGDIDRTRDGDGDGDRDGDGETKSSTPSLVIHITRQTTVEPAYPDALGLRLSGCRVGDGDGDGLGDELWTCACARKVTFDEKVVAWDGDSV